MIIPNGLKIYTKTIKDIIRLVWIARTHLKQGGISSLDFPGTQNYSIQTKTEVGKLLKVIDRIVNLLVLKSNRICFYRSFVLGSFLKHLNYPVEFNIGLRNLNNQSVVTGHCWLSILDDPVLEVFNPKDVYPYFITKNSDGIKYYLGLSDEQVERSKINKTTYLNYNIP
jgi:hypothetical protein